MTREVLLYGLLILATAASEPPPGNYLPPNRGGGRSERPPAGTFVKSKQSFKDSYVTFNNEFSFNQPKAASFQGQQVRSSGFVNKPQAVNSAEQEEVSIPARIRLASVSPNQVNYEFRTVAPTLASKLQTNGLRSFSKPETNYRPNEAPPNSNDLMRVNPVRYPVSSQLNQDSERLRPSIRYLPPKQNAVEIFPQQDIRQNFASSPEPAQHDPSVNQHSRNENVQSHQTGINVNEVTPKSYEGSNGNILSRKEIAGPYFPSQNPDEYATIPKQNGELNSFDVGSKNDEEKSEQLQDDYYSQGRGQEDYLDPINLDNTEENYEDIEQNNFKGFGQKIRKDFQDPNPEGYLEQDGSEISKQPIDRLHEREPNFNHHLSSQNPDKQFGGRRENYLLPPQRKNGYSSAPESRAFVPPDRRENNVNQNQENARSNYNSQGYPGPGPNFLKQEILPARATAGSNGQNRNSANSYAQPSHHSGNDFGAPYRYKQDDQALPIRTENEKNSGGFELSKQASNGYFGAFQNTDRLKSQGVNDYFEPSTYNNFDFSAKSPPTFNPTPQYDNRPNHRDDSQGRAIDKRPNYQPPRGFTSFSQSPPRQNTNEVVASAKSQHRPSFKQKNQNQRTNEGLRQPPEANNYFYNRKVNESFEIPRQNSAGLTSLPEYPVSEEAARQNNGFENSEDYNFSGQEFGKNLIASDRNPAKNIRPPTQEPQEHHQRETNRPNVNQGYYAPKNYNRPNSQFGDKFETQSPTGPGSTSPPQDFTDFRQPTPQSVVNEDLGQPVTGYDSLSQNARNTFGITDRNDRQNDKSRFVEPEFNDYNIAKQDQNIKNTQPEFSGPSQQTPYNPSNKDITSQQQTTGYAPSRKFSSGSAENDINRFSPQAAPQQYDVQTSYHHTARPNSGTLLEQDIKGKNRPPQQVSQARDDRFVQRPLSDVNRQSSSSNSDSQSGKDFVHPYIKKENDFERKNNNPAERDGYPTEQFSSFGNQSPSNNNVSPEFSQSRREQPQPFTGGYDNQGTEGTSNLDEIGPAKYEFKYRVNDRHSGIQFSQTETREGDTAQGRYHVLLPDGRLQTVDYEADSQGYRPTVSYQGEANDRGSPEGKQQGYSTDNSFLNSQSESSQSNDALTTKTSGGYSNEGYHAGAQSERQDSGEPANASRTAQNLPFDSNYNRQNPRGEAGYEY